MQSHGAAAVVLGLQSQEPALRAAVGPTGLSHKTRRLQAGKTSGSGEKVQPLVTDSSCGADGAATKVKKT